MLQAADQYSKIHMTTTLALTTTPNHKYFMTAYIMHNREERSGIWELKTGSFGVIRQRSNQRRQGTNFRRSEGTLSSIAV